MNIEVLADPETVAERAAAVIAGEAREAVASRGSFVMAVSGGHTPWLMLRGWPPRRFHGAPSISSRWMSVWRPPGHADRNLTHLRESLLGGSACPNRSMRCRWNRPISAAAAGSLCRDAAEIAGAPAGDRPGAPRPRPRRPHRFAGARRSGAGQSTNADVALSGPYQGRRRMTLTYPILNRARRILWVVTGSEKAGMVNRLLDGDRSIPAGRVRSDAALLLADCAAAPGHQLLERKKEEPYARRNRTDHGGFSLKEDLVADSGGGTRSGRFRSAQPGARRRLSRFRYSARASRICRKVDRGIAVCGSGVGASVCANKIPGVRAGLIRDHFSAHQGVEDDHMNMLCMGGRTVGPAVAWDSLKRFWQPNSARPSATCAGWAKWPPRGGNQMTPVSRNRSPATDRRSTRRINTIRTLSIDAVQQAKSGHPGTPMALAPLVYTIWNRVMRFDPQDPIWPNRDRFVLSNGHASMLLWSMLHLTRTQAVNAEYENLGQPR